MQKFRQLRWIAKHCLERRTNNVKCCCFEPFICRSIVFRSKGPYLMRSRTMASGGETSNNLSNKRQNRLVNELSPYLLQHASNPVDWYPWGQEAFDKAKAENKLIFLSVGYSTCHWCHVMERESFENEEIGRILNENFVSIKVDREERPDVDRVYMTFIQATSGGGGWPMSVWLTPELKPLFGGTYFPPDDRYYGRPGFKSVLNTIADQWKTRRGVIEEQSSVILRTLQEGTSASEAPGQSLPNLKACTENLYYQLERSFDQENGGFSKEPKFPQPVNFNFLFRMYAKCKDTYSDMAKSSLEMATFTLSKMAKGGIFDHISKGFHRYSTDAMWHVPHFEKMLYDQGQLLFTYAEAYQITREDEFFQVVRDIAEYTMRDLLHPTGGFYSAEDADSLPTADSTKKKEGAFCVWTYDQIQEILSEKFKDNLTLAQVFCHHFNVKEKGNVNPMQDPHDELKNQNVLIVQGSLEDTAQKFALSPPEVKDILEKCRALLYAERLKRPKPHLDDKIVAAWNGLMISGLSKAGQALKESAFVDQALKTATFLKNNMYNKESNILYRTSYVEEGKITTGSSPIEGFVDDYSFVIRGLLDLFEVCHDDTWVEWAGQLQEQQNALFWDSQGGAYYSNSGKDVSIVLKLKDDQDGAEPCPNSVAVSNLARLGTLLNKPEYHKKAATILKVFYERLTKIPIALPEMVCGLILVQDTPKQIVLVGDPDSDDLNALMNCVDKHYLPNKVTIICDGKSDQFLLGKLEFLKTLTKKDNKATAYVCENYSCELPVTSVPDLERILKVK
ncbi:spermatogenesis-associated protein 20-like isoform X2 [Saccostrea cucullata]|uniref:spermatogenesis-associated protein 20-like isoform X2 n=1 Tax=Saccostrea cuccullata TaxID=36930 RepID=UPI002ED2E11A